MSCKNSKAQNRAPHASISHTTTTVLNDFSGNYVTPEYNKRAKGYDWVAVSIKNVDKDKISISIRSRADKKKPTCTFDAIAYQLDKCTYKSVVDGKGILFTFTSQSMNIAAEKVADEGFLNYFCSGGATMAGQYRKLNEPLDHKQIDKTSYSKLLTFNTYEFHLNAHPAGNHQKLTAEIYGLKNPDTKVFRNFEGKITDAEVNDLNNDGFPEILIYISTGNDEEGKVLCYSVNKGLSISEAGFPDTNTNSKVNQGYHGHDEFTVIENNLNQRFPIFENGKETSKIRQVEYTLAEGEACRVFKVKHVTDFKL